MKKGSALDTIGVLVFVVGLLIVSLVGISVHTNLGEQAVINQTNNTQSAYDSVTSTLGMLDELIIGIFLVMFIATMITAFLVRTHPVFYAISIITWLMMTIVFYVIGYLLEEFLAAESLATAAANFPMTTYLASHMVLFSTVTFAAMVVIMYAVHKTD